METNELKVGDKVLWIGSPFTIVEIKGNKALLKQRFSIGVNLNGLVPLDEITLEPIKG